MLGTAKEIYVATRKKHDLIFNVYFMRPIAAFFVALFAKTPITPNQVTLLALVIFFAGTAILVGMPSFEGGLLGIAVIEASYCLDCVDGMLARFKKIASKEGHLFDFFTDELKATLLVSFMGVRFFRTGGLGIDGTVWAPNDYRFLIAALAGTVIITSGLSMTNFLRRPELSGRETTVEAHYETVQEEKPRSMVGKLARLVTTFLRFLNHYPSHIWAFAFAGRLEVFYWIYLAINLLYLARGWLGIFLRFGRMPKS